MPTFAADHELDRLEVEREAWTAYRASLAELEGREYELAEEEGLGAAAAPPGRHPALNARAHLG